MKKQLIILSLIVVGTMLLCGCGQAAKTRDISSYSGNIGDSYYKNVLDLSNKGLTELPDICKLITGAMKYDIRSIYLTNNSIPEIDKDLSCLVNLKVLDLSYNKIKVIKNLNTLNWLESLDLSHNQIEQIQNINDLVALKELNLSFNTIQEINGLDKLNNLIILFLSHNSITKIAGLKKLSNLQKITLEYNKLSNEAEVRNLYTIGKLKWISLGMNPLPQSVIDEFNQWTQGNIK